MHADSVRAGLVSAKIPSTMASSPRIPITDEDRFITRAAVSSVDASMFSALIRPSLVAVL